MKRILIVDDEFGIVEALTDVLVDEGYEVSTARNGQQALARIEAEAPDAIITDYMMPQMNGHELIAELKKRRSKVPIILMTAVDGGQLPGTHDVAATLRKPFALDALLRILKKLVG